MLGLTKVNEDWVPLQTKVFSRWVSNQLRDYPNIEINDIQKDLSNGVALVDLATVLTNKKPSRSWSKSPKLKVEMVQNCDLAIDMFSKDGVNFVGISGKDISDSNQKLILGLIWTLISNYSVGQSISAEKQNVSNDKSNKNNKKPQNSARDALLSWANQRIEHYPNIQNFAPFDLSLCALLDSYFPNKINYYSLNPEDSQHNSELALKVMNEIGIPIYVFPDELQKTNNVVDEKTLLTQLSSAKVVLDRVNIKDEKSESESEDSENEEVNTLKSTITGLYAEMLTLKDAREIAEKETRKISSELERAKLQIEDERSRRIRAESIIDEKRIENERMQRFNEQLTRAIFKLHIQFNIFNAQKQVDDEEIDRLRCAWEMAQIELENERDARQELEFELENLKNSMTSEVTKVLKAEEECRIPYLMNTISQIKDQIDLKVDDIEERVEKAQKNINSLEFNSSNESKQTTEIERLRCAWDMAQNELENERNARQEAEFQLNNLKRSMASKAANLINTENQLRMKSFMASFGDVQSELNIRLNAMQIDLHNAQKKVALLENYVSRVRKENVKLLTEQVQMADRMADSERKHKATIEAYSDSIQAALSNVRELEEEKEKADITIDHLMQTIENQRK